MKYLRKKLSYVLLLCLVIFSSCEGNEAEYDGLILTDIKTGRVYLLKHNMSDTYFVDERVIRIIGQDTTEVFE